ncbi:hypothetical protein [Niabella hibiscisoli]|uniref:hypothetical protein n=1 Tax=Niabella hibiscisoli TaxID=1825928 RepID=UPI001F0F8945|nr:hypothetical protein [Niabella hibiscisoli]MCH5718561.1 hypothetical protein [Niabella hibiscisoli]
MNDKIPSLQEEEAIVPIDENVEATKAITTEEEIEGSQIVKAILRELVPATRIAFRDTQSYFGILLDDNNRKPLARLHFNFSKKYLELFHNGKDNGERKLLESLDDIYKYRKELLMTIQNYQQNSTATETVNTTAL